MAEKNRLARKIGLNLLVFYGLGNILGAGIYVLIGKVSAIAGMFAPLSFLTALIVVSFTAFSYMELSSRFPVAAGEAVYVQEGLHQKWLSVAIGITIVLAGLLSAAAIISGFSGYISEVILFPKVYSLVFIVIVLALIAIWGIGESVKIAASLTVLEIAGLLIIIVVGAPVLKELPTQWSNLLPRMNWEDIQPIILGSFLAFYAFIGFEDMVNVAEEVNTPRKTMPKAIIFTLILATLLYLAVSLISVLLLTPQELGSTDAPFALLYKEATGEESAVYISLISLFAIINGALIQMIMASRMIYGMSFNGWLPPILAEVNAKTQTPIYATIAVMIMVLILALWFPLVGLANMTSGLILGIFTVINFSLLRIKIKDPNPKDIFTVSMAVPIIGMIVNLFFLSVQIFS